MGSMAGKEPQHANFSARQTEAIGNKLVYPLAIFQGITGVAPDHRGAGSARRASRGSSPGSSCTSSRIIYALTVQRNALHHLSS